MSKRERTQLTEEAIDVLSRLTSIRPGEIAMQLLTENGLSVLSEGKTIIYKARKPQEKRAALKVRSREIKKIDTSKKNK